ncbi:MAG: PKD domain-containing protein [Bacteroidetes bacterium]|nr:PKD domain-containing protein [Bacteroidota bacterium]
MKKIILLSTLFAVTCFQAVAQCLMYPVNLSQRVAQSSLIVEGKVLNQHSFWNTSHDKIFTSNLVEVYKSFKGTSPVYLEIITEGGTVGNDRHVVEPTLELNTGDQGVFTLVGNTQPSQFGRPVYEAFASAQGFIKYDVAGDYATEPFQKYNNLSTTLYTTLQQATNTSYAVVKNVNPFQVAALSGNSVQNTAAITSFSPSTITAGTFSVLTINGSGFGTSTGTVSFANADDGGATYINAAPAQIVSWSNTQIQVQVPTKTSISGTAGTGLIKVNGVASTQTLTVSYGHLNVDYSSAIYNTQHIGQTSGGYTWIYNSSFITNAPAKAAFERSFGTWRCATYINWQISASTTTVAAAANDAVNVITFQTGLAAGILGQCTSYWSGCGSGATMKWFVNELDIVFAPTPGGLTWQYGPAAPSSSQYDFESVTVHELGHGHQLSHVINSSDLMHYALANGQQKRSLNTDDLNGGLAVMTRNLAGTVCSKPIMVALNSGNCALGAPTASFTANKTTICAGQSITFTNASTGGATSYTWTFQGGTPATSTATTPPAVTYNTPGSYSVALSASNTNGTSTYSVLAYINVVSAATLPLVQAFQTSTFTPANWYLNDGGNDGVKWSLSTSAGQASTQSAMFDNWTTDVSGTRDELKTYVNLSGYNTAKMTFYRAYGLTYASPNIDSLEILISTNCGTSTTQAYLKGGSQIGTGVGTGSFTYVPATTEWAKDSIDLTPYVGNASVMVSFVNRSHYGDGMYLDNINITGATASAPTATISTSASTVCAGQSVTLTNTSTGSPTSYTWTMTGGTPATANTSSTTVSYATAGVKTISLTVATGTLSSTSTKTITVVANPTVAATTTLSTICSGQSTSLFVTGATSYVWNPGGQTTTSVTVNPTSNTVYTVTGTTSGCASTGTVAVTVNPSPTVSIGGATSICSGGSTTFTASGATTYTWAPGGQTTTNVTVSPTVTTTYTLTGASSGCTSTSMKTLTVSATPTIAVATTNTTICSGTTTTLNVTGATTYTWNPGGLTGTSVIVSPGSTTVYTVTGANGSCTGTSKTSTVTVTPGPTVTASASASLICAGQSATLTASGATTYTWNPGGLTGTSVVVNPGTTTTYTVSGSNGTCTGLATKVLNVSTCTGISEVLADGGLRVYPNPNTGEFTVTMGNTEMTMYVYNAVGQLVVSEKLTKKETHVNLSSFSKGVYYVQLFNNDSRKTVKLIVE